MQVPDALHAIVAALIVLASWASAETMTEGEVWAATIDVAGMQRMLSQRMSKEYLLVVQGFQVEKNKAALHASVLQFDAALLCLSTGCPEKSIHAPSPRVTEGLEHVLSLWRPFMKLLEAPDRANLTSLETLAVASTKLLQSSNEVVGRLVDDAEIAGMAALGESVNIAGRQRMLIQRMCKELFLVGLGVGGVGSLQNLRQTYRLFLDSHRGLILGAPWAGVPALDRRCALQQMREVTYEWGRFKLLVGQVLAENEPEKSRKAAAKLTADVSTAGADLFDAMKKAVQFYINETEACEKAAVSGGEWSELLATVGRQTTMGQQAMQLILQVGLNKSVAHSKVELVNLVSTAEANIRSLIEGSKASAIPAPPTQAIADQLLVAYGVWVRLKDMLEVAIGSTVDLALIHQSASLCRQHYEAMQKAASLFRGVCSSDVDTELLGRAQEQLALPVKMAKEASLVLADDQAAENGEAFNATAEQFLRNHRCLLLGDEDEEAGSASRPAPPVCIVRKMRTAAILFGELRTASLSVASGSADSVEAVIRLLPLLLQAGGTAAKWFSQLPAEPTCSPTNITSAEWLGAILELGKLRELAQRLLSARLLADLDNSSQELESAAAALESSAHKVAFGSHEVPAPPTQELQDLLWGDLVEFWRVRKPLVSNRKSPLSLVTSTSNKLLEVAELLMERYMSMAQLPTELKHRVDVASRQALLAQRAFRSVLQSRGSGLAMGEVYTALAAFSAGHRLLAAGGQRFPGIIPQRPDLRSQQAVVQGLWTRFEGQATQAAVPRAGSQDLRSLRWLLTQLLDELEAAARLFGEEDPFVPPEEPQFPYTAFIYTGVAMVLLGVCCAGMFAALCRDRRRPMLEANTSMDDWGLAVP